MNRTEISSLPDEVLPLILQHVDPKQRLTISALLSTRFRDAAIAATGTIQLETKSLAKTESLAAWLRNHGADITCLKLSSAQGFQLHELPCVHLKTLELQDATMSLSVPGPLDSCSDLHSLTFKDCTIPATSDMPVEGADQFAGLAKLVSLQHLSFMPNRCHVYPHTVSLQGRVLSGLCQLTSLLLKYPAAVTGFSNLCALTALQELEVCLSVDTTSAELAEVHQLQSLTWLYLDCHTAAGLRITPHDTPGISQLTRLEGLGLHNCDKFDPLLIKPMTQLQNLQLRYAILPGGFSAGVSALLAVLSELSSLTLLDLRGSLTPGPGNLTAYTALSALPNLAAIWLDECLLPAGLWQYLSETGCVMSRLASVSLTRSQHLSDELEAADELPGLAACCPNVERIELIETLGGELDLQALVELPFLTKLYFAPADGYDIKRIAELPWLRCLCLDHLTEDVTDQVLLHLTALTALTRLELPGVPQGWVGQLSTELSVSLTQALRQDAGRPCIRSMNVEVPDVWQQLVAICMSSSRCRPVLLSQLQGLDRKRTQAAARLAAVQQHDDNAGQNCQCLHCMSFWNSASRRESWIMEREAWVSSAEPCLIKTEAILSTWSQHLGQCDANLASEAAALDVSNGEVSGLETQLSAHAAELADGEARLAAAQEQLAAREAAVVEREQQVGLHEQRVATRFTTREQQLTATDWQLTGHAAAIAAREQQAARHETRLAAWQAQLEVQEQNVARAAAAAMRYGFEMP